MLFAVCKAGDKILSVTGEPYDTLMDVIQGENCGSLKDYGVSFEAIDLDIDENGRIFDYKLRCEQTKLTTVKAFHSAGIETIASGDSYNDIGMIKNSKAGFLFKSTDKIKHEYPEITALETYDELYDAITKAL